MEQYFMDISLCVLGGGDILIARTKWNYYVTFSWA